MYSLQKKEMEKKKKQREMIKNEIRKAGGIPGRGWGRGRGRGGRGSYGFGNYHSDWNVGDFSVDYNEQRRKDTLELARMRQRVSSLSGVL